MKVKVAVIQESPLFFAKEATLVKLERLVREYAAAGCQLLVFPESFVPGYPRGFSFGAVVGSRTEAGRALYAEFHRNSIDLAGADRPRLEALARENGVYLVIGVTERLGGSLYCSMLYLGPQGGLLAVHRKVKPTGTERLFWAEAGVGTSFPEPGKFSGGAAGAGLDVVPTKLGRLGGLICWENYLPQARLRLYRQGVQLYLAPTADAREVWTATLRHIALEGRCFVLGCNQYFTKSMYPDRYRELAAAEPEEMCPGGSVIVSPLGELIAGPLFGEAGALVAELDLEDIVGAQLDFDVVGHYNRPDLF